MNLKIFCALPIVAAVFSAIATGDTITESQSATTSVSQDGFYQLWRSGNSHAWLGTPSPDAGDGYAYGNWSLDYDISAMPKSSSVTSASINASWSIDAPTVYPALWNYPFGAIPWDQPIKYMTPEASGWLSELTFSDGYTYWFPGPPRQNPTSLDLLALGLEGHLEDSTGLTLVGTLQYKLGRAYLADDWQSADGWAEWAVTHAFGTATATGSGTLNLTFDAPPPPPPPPTPVSSPTPEPGPFTTTFLGSSLIALGLVRHRKEG